MTVTVSVIVPCYRQARYLPHCIGSLADQTLQSWEAIIVDDGSPDETAAVAASLAAADSRVRYVRKDNGGLSSARNAGLRAASGDFIQFLDADDLIEPRKLEAHANHLRHGNIDIVFGNAWYFIDGNPAHRVRNGYAPRWRRDENWIERRARSPASMIEKLLRRPQFPVCSALVRRSFADRAGAFNESMRRLEDWEYWVRCAALGGRFSYLDAAGSDALIRMHSASMTADRRAMIRSEFELAMNALEYISEPALRRRAIRLAAAGLEGFDGPEWSERYEVVRRRAAADPVATRWLRLYRGVCGQLRAQSVERRLALRVVRALP